MSKMTIAPLPTGAFVGFAPMGTLSHIGAGEIERRLGIAPERNAVEGVSDHEWRFLVNGVACEIYDWHGSGRHGVWSTKGPREVFLALFGWRAVT